MRIAFFTAVLLITTPAFAQNTGVDVTIPLVEKALRFLQTKALSPPSEATLLRAGVMRVCGDDLSGSGCSLPGHLPPREGISGPDANRAWRHILESSLAASSLSQEDFDKTVFQRYIMDAMVVALEDPASFYVLPSVYRKISSIPQEFVGFGMRVAPEADSLRILAVHTGSPAHDAGLLHGEKIIRVNGQEVTGVRRPIALGAIWGADGEKLTLTVKGTRGVARDVVVAYKEWRFEAFSVQRHGDFSVVQIRYFGKGVADAVRAELASSCGGLVLDLRDAAAGGEDEMVNLADLLLEEGSIGTRQMRGDLGTRVWAASGDTAGQSLETPVAVVLNQGTSGLAEVLAMALRRHNRAVLIGRQSAGMDTLETIQPFKDGSAIQITSQRLLGPDEATLSQGVLPHVKTRRSRVVDLAAHILELTASHKMEDMLAAARLALAQP